MNQVSEYWIADADKKTIEQYILEGEQFKLREKLNHGTIKCAVLEGLEIELKMILDNRNGS